MAVTVEGLKRAGRELTREKFIAALESLRGYRPENLTATHQTGRPRAATGLNTVRLMRAKKAADASVRAGERLADVPARIFERTTHRTAAVLPSGKARKALNANNEPLLLDVRGLSLSFGGIRALRSVSLSLTEGESVAIIARTARARPRSSTA